MNCFPRFRRLIAVSLLPPNAFLHRSLVETNIALRHELRTRREIRRFSKRDALKQLLSAPELERIRCTAALDRRSLAIAAWHSITALQEIIDESVLWRIPPQTLESYCALREDTL